MSDHIAIEELADAGAGLVDDERAPLIDAHLLECADCRETAAALAGVGALLAAEPAPAMPDAVAQRLADVLATESRRRATASPPRGDAFGPGGSAGHGYVRPTLGQFGAELTPRRRSRFLLPALAACVAASVVGFAGYVISASAGLNEPPTNATAVVNVQQLGAEAHSLLLSNDLSAHPFSRAWRCARDVTDGRITAITGVVVDDAPALLVYTRSDDVEHVTVVTGCNAGDPVAGPSTTLPR